MYIFVKWFNDNHCLVLEYCYDSHTHQQSVTLCCPFSFIWASVSVPSVSVALSILDMPHKQNHPLCLASFTQHVVNSKFIHAVACVSINFYGWMMSRYKYIFHFVYLAKSYNYFLLYIFFSVLPLWHFGWVGQAYFIGHLCILLFNIFYSFIFAHHFGGFP